MSDLYQVEYLLGRKTERGQVYYRVKWSGYGSQHNSWEPEENLSNCQDLIEEYMEKEGTKERKRSLRSSPARSKRAIAATALSSDDEVTSTASPRKKQVAKKSPGRPARTTKKNQPALESPLPAGLFGREYHLRSKESKNLVLSSDDESSPAVERRTKKTTSANTRMSLRESNFRRQLSDRDTSTRKVATSTPQPKAPSNKSPQVKTKMRFEAVPKKGRDGRPFLSIQEVTVGDETTKDKSGKNLSVIEEAEEEEKGNTPVPQDTSEAYPAWPPVGWKEFALAAFVTGLAAVGYVCYTTDYCSFC